MTKTKDKKIKNCMIVQQLRPEFFKGWSDEELNFLLRSEGSCRVQPFVKRLSKDKALKSCYLVFHDKDKKTPHLHLVLDFWYPVYTIEELSALVGISTQCIELGRSKKFSLDNFLAYLVHAKDPQKFQYDPREVISWVDSNMTQNHPLLYENLYKNRIDAWRAGAPYKQKILVKKG